MMDNIVEPRLYTTELHTVADDISGRWGRYAITAGYERKIATSGETDGIALKTRLY